MTLPALAVEVTEFIERNIHSVAQLEILLLLHGGRPRRWSAEEVSRELRLAIDSVHASLEDLTVRGLFRREDAGAYSYEPNKAEAALTVDLLSVAYRERRVTVIELIFAKPNSNLRGFADAFRLKKGDD